jgi:AraC-like DNA-binding protein
MRFLRALVDTGERLGVDRVKALDAIGIGRSEIEDATAWLPVATMTRAWEIVPELSGDPDFGLHAAEAAALGVYGPLDLAAMSCATVADGVLLLERYYATLGGMSEVHTTHDDDGAVKISLAPVVRAKTSLRHYVENFFAVIVTRLQAAALLPSRGRLDIDLVLQHRAPANVAEHARLFGPRVRFGAKKNELRFAPKTAKLALRTANPELTTILEREGARLALRPDAPMKERVTRAIEQGLREGDASLEAIARRLALGTRTMQRQLRAEGTSFADVLDGARKDIALKSIAADGPSIAELAYQLGFAQPSAFYRAFKRWTGSVPAAWRAKRA